MGNINGSPETAAAKLVNGGFDLSENTQMYYNAAYVYKSKLICLRTPYWRTLSDFPYLKDFFGTEQQHLTTGMYLLFLQVT
jgi:iron complex outermembrane receptor protein